MGAKRVNADQQDSILVLEAGNCCSMKDSLARPNAACDSFIFLLRICPSSFDNC